MSTIDRPGLLPGKNKEPVMVKRYLFSVLVVALTAELTPAFNSTGTRLTPGNVNGQTFQFVIHAEKIGVLTRFVVSVKRRTDNPTPKMAGYLLILDGKTQLASCPVAPQKQPEKVLYEFMVSSKHLEKSRFLLEEKDLKKQGIPLNGRYWFFLEDFALAQISTMPTQAAVHKQ